MERIEKSFEVGLPVSLAYIKWTQYRATSLGGDIVEQVPDRMIQWSSTTAGTPNAGKARFDPLGGERTRISVSMEYEAEGALEGAREAREVVSNRVDETVHGFQRFVEKGTTGGEGLAGAGAAGNPGARGAAPGAAGGAMTGGTGGTPGPGGGKVGSTPGGTPGAG